MQIVHAKEMPWSEQEEKHREGSLAFKTLFKGREGDPNNFRCVLSRSNGDYHSPHHRHSFDQIRYCLEGSANIAPGKTLHQGDVGFFPEGTFYGPQNDEARPRLTLVFQGGGASGLGYMSSAQLRRGQEALARVGTFGGGRFRLNGQGEAASRDSYEAIWEHVHERPIAYPPPRYDEPILIRTAAFAWLPDKLHASVSRKLLGTFTERGTRLELVGLDAGATMTLGSPDATVLAFVTRGGGRCGDERWQEHSAFCLDGKDTAVLQAASTAELLVITLPTIRPAAM